MATLILAGLGFTAFAATSGTEPDLSATGQLVAAQQPASPPAGADPVQLSAFAVLARPPATPPADVTRALTNETTFAPNPKAAVSVNLPPSVSNRPAWIAPARDSLCLYVPDTEGGATTCAATRDATAGGLMMFLLRGGTQTVVGVAPDGVASAHVLGTAPGSGGDVAVHNNVYAVRTSGADSVAVAGTVRTIPTPPRLTVPPLPAP
jgi:hypothetical protein